MFYETQDFLGSFVITNFFLFGEMLPCWGDFEKVGNVFGPWDISGKVLGGFGMFYIFSETYFLLVFW